jgi:hypothetical protein
MSILHSLRQRGLTLGATGRWSEAATPAHALPHPFALLASHRLPLSETAAEAGSIAPSYAVSANRIRHSASRDRLPERSLLPAEDRRRQPVKQDRLEGQEGRDRRRVD